MVSESEVLYPYIDHTQVFVAMSGEGYAKYVHELEPGGVLVYESDLVRPDLSRDHRAYGIPSTRIAESLGKRIVQNIVMTGFIAGVAGILPPETMREAVAASVPAGTEDLNLKAFDEGLIFARRQLAGSELAEAGAAREEVHA